MLDKKRIRGLRFLAGLSQAELGKLIHQEATYVSKLERGKLTNITPPTLIALANALECSTDYLLGLSDVPERNTKARTYDTHPVAV